eukprot:1158151-Pelagomonas_calceolata.AAC.5
MAPFFGAAIQCNELLIKRSARHIDASLMFLITIVAGMGITVVYVILTIEHTNTHKECRLPSHLQHCEWRSKAFAGNVQAAECVRTHAHTHTYTQKHAHTHIVAKRHRNTRTLTPEATQLQRNSAFVGIAQTVAKWHFRTRAPFYLQPSTEQDSADQDSAEQDSALIERKTVAGHTLGW